MTFKTYNFYKTYYNKYYIFLIKNYYYLVKEDIRKIFANILTNLTDIILININVEL